MPACMTPWQIPAQAASMCCHAATSSCLWKPPSLHPPPLRRQDSSSRHSQWKSLAFENAINGFRWHLPLFSLLKECLDLTRNLRFDLPKEGFPLAHLSRDTRIWTWSCWEATQSPAIGDRWMQMLTGSLLGSRQWFCSTGSLLTKPFKIQKVAKKKWHPTIHNKEMRRKKEKHDPGLHNPMIFKLPCFLRRLGSSLEEWHRVASLDLYDMDVWDVGKVSPFWSSSKYRCKRNFSDKKMG